MQNFELYQNGMTEKKRPIAAIMAALIMWLVYFFGDVAYAEPKLGGVLHFGAENDFAGFELLQSGSRLAINGAIVANTIMEPLFRMDDNENLIPVLGLSAEPSDDGKAWTIKLRQKVTFHDGTPFSADSVVAHWERLLNPKNKYRGRLAMGAIIGVTKVDEYTVQFILKHPWLPFKRAITSTRTLSNLIPSNKAVTENLQHRSPIGTGPFMFKEWKSGDSLRVVKNPNYWRKDRPYLDQIVFKPLPDAQTRFASLKSGQLDIIWMDRGNLINEAKADDKLKVYIGEDNGAEIFILNTSRPPLNDINVRRALAHAHNQIQQIKIAYQDSIPSVQHPFGHQCHCTDNGYRSYNPDKALELLTNYGLTLEIEVLHSNSKRGRDIGAITQQLFKNVGITSNPIGLDFGPVVKKVINGDYQMSTWRISSRPDQGPALFSMFHSQSRANFARYQSEDMDKLLIAQRIEMDPQKRNQLLCQIARLINEDVPILYRGGMRSHLIANTKLQGIPTMKNGMIQFDEVWINH